jgi:hypothetical protein
MSTNNTATATATTATATATTATATTVKTSNLTQIMNNISNNVNPKTTQEGLGLVTRPDELIARLQSGADQFKEQTGRNMTYSEMRQMFG